MIRRAAPAMARLALTACLTVIVHSAPANDYPPPPGPFKSEPGALPGISPAVRVGRQSDEAVSALPEVTAQVLSTGSGGRETTRGRYEAAARSGSTSRDSAAESFRPAAATEYSQPPALPRPAATPLSPGDRVYPANPEERRDATPGAPSRASSASNRPGDLMDTRADSASGDARVGHSASAFRTGRPRSPVDSGEPARRMPQTPVFRPSEPTGR